MTVEEEGKVDLNTEERCFCMLRVAERKER